MQPRCFSAPPGSAPVEPRCAGPSPRCGWRRPCRDRGSWHCARRGAVKRYGFRIVVAARPRFRHEMVMAIPAAHERGTILAGELRHVSREIADGKADAPVVRRAGSRACPREGGGPALAKAGDGIRLRDVIGVDTRMWDNMMWG